MLNLRSLRVFLILILVDEVGEKADKAILALKNNDLLKRCTVRGETNDWKRHGNKNEDIFVTGMTFYNYIIGFINNRILVNMGYGYPKTSPWYKGIRINTWLSCVHSCWHSVGAQNVYLGVEDRFRIFIKQKPSLTIKDAAERGYVLHYEVEYPCAE